jgi:hypothetical protein
VIGPSGFREIARSATVSYPIPFAFALCLAFAVLSLGGAMIAADVMRWVLVSFAAASTLFAFTMLAVAAIWKPQLLRSERQEISHRVMDFIEDSDLGPQTMELGRLLLDAPTKKTAVAGGRKNKGSEAPNE